MASRYHWRNISVFLGFNEDSSVGLLIGQQLGRQSIAIYDKAIRGMQNGPARLKQEMLFHSNAHITGLRKTSKNQLNQRLNKQGGPTTPLITGKFRRLPSLE